MEWLTNAINHEYVSYGLIYFIVCSLTAVFMIFKAILQMETPYELADGWALSFFKLLMVVIFFPMYLYWIRRAEIKEW